MENKKPPYFLFGIGIMSFVLSILLYILIVRLADGNSIATSLLIAPLVLMVLGIGFITLSAVRAITDKNKRPRDIETPIVKSPAPSQVKNKLLLKKIFLYISLVIAGVCLVVSIIILKVSNTDVPDAGLVAIYAFFIFLPLMLVFLAISAWLAVSMKRTSKLLVTTPAPRETKQTNAPEKQL